MQENRYSAYMHTNDLITLSSQIKVAVRLDWLNFPSNYSLLLKLQEIIARN